jgi:molybdate transport system substrate-binding protein
MSPSFRRLVRRPALVTLIAVASLGFAAVSAGAEDADVPAIAAASDLQFALTEAAEAFRNETGREVKLTFGSSGNFFRQIQEGAPFEMYLSADEKFVVDLAEKGFAVDDGTLYAIGRIVIIVPHGSPLKADAELADLKAAVTDGRVTKFAIASPEHAPYGQRAEEALRHAGIWDALRGKLVLGENVSQAAQFATTGGAQGGIVAYSLALSPNVAKVGSFALIPETWHEPLRQRMALLRKHRETAKQFYAFVQGKTARTIMRRYGFVLPGEPAT